MALGGIYIYIPEEYIYIYIFRKNIYIYSGRIYIYIYIPECLLSSDFLGRRLSVSTLFFETFAVYGLCLNAEIIFHGRELRSSGVLRSE
jgi:hypothetical protein